MIRKFLILFMTIAIMMSKKKVQHNLFINIGIFVFLWVKTFMFVEELKKVFLTY